MKLLLRRALALFLCELMIFLPAAEGIAGAKSSSDQPPQQPPLHGYLQKSYLELFELAPKLNLTSGEIKAQRKALEKSEDFCVSTFKNHAKQYKAELDKAQQDLKKISATLDDLQRQQAHCKIQNLELLKSEAEILSGHAIPTAYENLTAKLELLEKWPALYRQTRQEIASESYLNRRWADLKDIGFREIEPNQQDDIKAGQQSIEEMKRSGMMPRAIEDKAVLDYVNTVAQQIARHSDLKVPLHVSVLQSKEINAFALPGGYLFLERGLLEAADDESELAGVIAHEISHDVARHSHKLMKRATIASLFYQAAQIAAVILTGGVAGIGLYYALQYGFYGLGMVLNLKLLGVSRDYELEADQLGVQYAWNAGYDPSGFIRFFDKIANREGYVNGVSWFRTHPPFYQRMVDAQREILFLPAKSELITQTSAFTEMKDALPRIAASAEREDAGKPTLLLKHEQGCEPPKKLEYKPGQPIEELCSRPAQPSRAESGK